MGKIYIPALNVEDWKQLLADPEKQWKSGYSARALAYCWQEADGFPSDVRAVLSKAPEFNGIEALLVIPEHQVPLPGGARPSQSDVWVLARANVDLVSIAVEGKVSESFGPTIDEWGPESSPGKKKRLAFLCEQLGIEGQLPGEIRYQLLHRSASAVIEAKRFLARHAVMLVHSFSQTDEWFEDYGRFLSLYGVSGNVNEMVSVRECSGISLHFAWVQGDKRYLQA